MTTFLQLVVSGTLVGGLYGLIAMGFVITYRSGNVFNMAYGQFAALGAFMAWTFLGSPSTPRLPIPFALFLTLLFAISFGLFVERVFFRKLSGRPVFAAFILSLGLLALLTGAVLGIWGPSHLALKLLPQGAIYLGDLTLAQEHVWACGVALVTLSVLAAFFRWTRLGLAIRAAHDNQVAAQCLGISARLNAQIAWVISTIIATIGGVLIASVVGVSGMLGELALAVLAVVLLGGMESLLGCIAGGLILTVGGNLTSYYLGTVLPGIGEIFGLILILVILIFRPSGLFGARPVERV
jgi:branched-chain amino acid transport system permease protein